MIKFCSLWLGFWVGRIDFFVFFNWIFFRFKIFRVFIGSYDVDKFNWRFRIEVVEYVFFFWRQRFLLLGRRFFYFCNGIFFFNFFVIRIVLGGDVYLQFGLSRIVFRCFSIVRFVVFELDVFLKNIYVNIKIVYFNVRFLKFRENFILVKDFI